MVHPGASRRTFSTLCTSPLADSRPSLLACLSEMRTQYLCRHQRGPRYQKQECELSPLDGKTQGNPLISQEKTGTLYQQNYITAIMSKHLVPKTKPHFGMRTRPAETTASVIARFIHHPSRSRCPSLHSLLPGTCACHTAEHIAEGRKTSVRMCLFGAFVAGVQPVHPSATFSVAHISPVPFVLLLFRCFLFTPSILLHVCSSTTNS